MTESTKMTTTQGADNEGQVCTTRDEAWYATPPVDIYEVDDGLTVVVDMPGVAKDDVEVRVDNGKLEIKGTARLELPGDPLYAEFQLVNFYRQFQLGEAVDQAKIQGELKNGVLVLRLPAVEQAKPRRIEVSVG